MRILSRIEDSSVTRDIQSALGIQNLVKEILAPRFVGATQIPDDLTVDVKVVCLRAFKEPHPSSFRRAVALAVVAGAAAGHQVLPGGITSARSWGYVIERQILRREDSTTVLTGVVVAKQDVLAGEALSLKWNVYVFHQPDDRRHRHRKPRGMQPLCGTLFGVGDAL